jgi:hypothetical protein
MVQQMNFSRGRTLYRANIRINSCARQPVSVVKKVVGTIKKQLFKFYFQKGKILFALNIGGPKFIKPNPLSSNENYP